MNLLPGIVLRGVRGTRSRSIWACRGFMVWLSFTYVRLPVPVKLARKRTHSRSRNSLTVFHWVTYFRRVSTSPWPFNSDQYRFRNCSQRTGS